MSMASPQWGGRRTPRNPAPVSGPGQLSRRTDGGPQQTTQDMTGMAYGENADFNAIQSAAPLSASQQPSAGRTRLSRSGGQGVPGVPLFSPTGFPEEPVTAGADMNASMMQTTPPSMTQGMGTLTNTVRKMAASDPSGDSLRLLAIVERLGW